MRIDNNVGCSVASCPVDLGPNCASSLSLSSAGQLMRWIVRRPGGAEGTLRLDGLPRGLQERVHRRCAQRQHGYVPPFPFPPSLGVSHLRTATQPTRPTAAQVRTTRRRRARRRASQTTATLVRPSAAAALRIDLTWRALFVQRATARTPTRTHSTSPAGRPFGRAAPAPTRTSQSPSAPDWFATHVPWWDAGHVEQQQSFSIAISIVRVHCLYQTFVSLHRV